MSRALTAFVIGTAFVTTLIVIGAPWLRLAQRKEPEYHTANEARLAKGEEFFHKFVQLDRNRDLAILDLYADTAIIIDRRPSPNGQINDLNIPIAAFRPMLRGLYVVAKAAGDPPSVYRGMSHFADEVGVRIETDCYSPSDEFQRRLSMFVRPGADDIWRIEELIVDSPEVRR